jgi:hypothetical protein
MENTIQFYSKDIQIIRQSQSKLVLDYINTLNIKLNVEEFQRVTDIFVECCIRPQDPDLKDRIKKLDKWLSGKKI